jgi:3-oxoacyl-[acyl-carrier-protein] synthase II
MTTGGCTGIGAITQSAWGVTGCGTGCADIRGGSGHAIDRRRFGHVAASGRPSPMLDERRSRHFDRQFSVVASRMAIDDSGLVLERENRERIGAMMGSALGGVAYAEDQMGKYMSGGLRAVDATLALAVFGGAASCNVAIEFGVYGPNSTNAMSCASGTIAVGDAFRSIRDTYADVMICGGAEAPLSTLCYGAFSLIRAMSTRNDDPATASRPFDRDRDGFVMGEGSAVLVLEERERALARGAPVYAEVLGFGMSNDGHHMTAPRPDGSQAARAMRVALQDAHVDAGEIGYVNAHGSSTPLNDPTETLAMKQVLGEHAYRVPISGTKGYYGHALGASGAIEAAICALALDRRWLPPTVNLASPDPACDLDFVTGPGRAAEPETIISNSFGFGGINASLVMRRHQA